MNKAALLIEFFEKTSPWKQGVNELREIIMSTELEETYKWQFPTYTLKGKNVIAIGNFKGWFGIWFFQGVFLTDPLQVLTNAQEGKTKAMRHWKFDSIKNLPHEDILTYINEAIANQKAGKVVKVEKKKKTTKPLVMPELLADLLVEDESLKAAFYGLSEARQRGHADYINEVKQMSTKEKRLAKILPLIRAGRPVQDLYNKS